MLKLLSPKQIKDVVTKRFSNNYRQWFAQQGEPAQGAEPNTQSDWPLQFNLGNVTEAQALTGMALLRQWVTEWSSPSEHWSVTTQEKRWPRLGAQTLPQQVSIPDVDAAVALAGQTTRWTRAKHRAEELILLWPQLPWVFLSRQFEVLADYDDREFEQLRSVLTWLVQNPQSNVFVRELPISGIDSKWVQAHQAVLTSFLKVLLAAQGDEDFYTLTGLKRNLHQVRIRILDAELRKQFAGLCDMAVPLEELARLTLRPQMLLLVENQATGLSLPDMPGVIAVMQMGRSVGALSKVPWMQGVPALYWGDLDTYGFVCLNQARQALPQLQSVLMDEETLLSHKELWAREDKQAPDEGLEALTTAEQSVYDGLKSQRWGDHVRLEQERIVWPQALDALRRSCNHIEHAHSGFPG